MSQIKLAKPQLPPYAKLKTSALIRSVARTLAFVKKATTEIDVLKSRLKTSNDPETIKDIAWLTDLSSSKAREAMLQLKEINHKAKDYLRKI